MGLVGDGMDVAAAVGLGLARPDGLERALALLLDAEDAGAAGVALLGPAIGVPASRGRDGAAVAPAEPEPRFGTDMAIEAAAPAAAGPGRIGAGADAPRPPVRVAPVVAGPRPGVMPAAGGPGRGRVGGKAVGVAEPARTVRGPIRGGPIQAGVAGVVARGPRPGPAPGGVPGPVAAGAPVDGAVRGTVRPALLLARVRAAPAPVGVPADPVRRLVPAGGASGPVLGNAADRVLAAPKTVRGVLPRGGVRWADRPAAEADARTDEPGADRPGDDVRTPAMAPREPPAGAQGGAVLLDGRLVGRWLMERMGQAASRPAVGMTGFDPRQSAAWRGDV